MLYINALFQSFFSIYLHLRYISTTADKLHNPFVSDTVMYLQEKEDPGLRQFAIWT